jgi:hypothetical protein
LPREETAGKNLATIPTAGKIAQLFWDVWLKERKVVCRVDIERLFQNAQTWDEIINQRMVSVDWGSEN